MRYFIGLLAIVALILGVLLLILRGLGGDEPKTQKLLTEYTNTDTVMQLTIQGPINAEQEHQGVRILVGQHETRVEILQGYEERVTTSQSYVNNEKAYGTFLRALELQNYTRGSEDPKLTDERGYCPEGNRFIFEIRNGDRQIQKFWKSSCDEGNFAGDAPGIITLFEDQIPDYRSFTSDVEL